MSQHLLLLIVMLFWCWLLTLSLTKSRSTTIIEAVHISARHRSANGVPATTTTAAPITTPKSSSTTNKRNNNKNSNNHKEKTINNDNLVATHPRAKIGTPNGYLKCYCDLDYCIDNTCQTTSYCFAFTERVEDADGQYYDEYSYGCLPPAEGALMQCRSNITPHETPKNLTCCHEVDYCNKYSKPYYQLRPDQMKVSIFSRENLHYFLYTFVLVVGLIVSTITIKSLNAWLKLKYTKSTSSSSLSKKHNHLLDTDESLDQIKRSSTSIIKEHHNHANQFMVTKSALNFMSAHTTTHDSETSATCTGSIATYHDDDVTSGVGTRALMPLTISKQILLDEDGEIGRGRFGRVVRGSMCDTPVAVKIFLSVDEDSWKRERFIYDQCIKNHENILGYYASDVISKHDVVEFWLITHYCKYGSLYDFLSNEDEILTEAQSLTMIHSIIDGLDYLHRQSFGCGYYKPAIAHRDIKSKNILMKSKTKCCIADFGHAVINMPDNTINRGHAYDMRVGTKRYMAPEVLTQTMDPNKFRSYAMSDVYQFALVVWEICNRIGYDALDYCLPYGDIFSLDPSIEDMTKLVYIDQYRPPLRKSHKHIIKSLNQILEECWTPNPDARCAPLRIKKKIHELQEKEKQERNKKQETSNSPKPDYKFSDGCGSSGYYGDDGVAL